MPRFYLPLIVLAQFTGTSLWFAGNALLAGYPGFAPASLSATVQIGFIGGTLLSAFLLLSDRFSAPLLFLWSALLGALANALIPFCLLHPPLVLGLRVVTGFFLAGIYPVGMKIAADLFPKGLGEALGWLVGALVLGTAFPHLVKDQLHEMPVGVLFWVVSAMASLGGLLLFLFIPSSQIKKTAVGFQPSALLEIISIVPFRKAALGYLGHMWELYSFWAFVPLIILAYTKTEVTLPFSVSYLSFCVIAIGAVGCVLGGQWAAKKGSRQVSMVALTISGICCLLLPLMMYADVVLFILFLLVWGMSVVADSPQLSALAAATAPVHLKGTALTALTCAGFALTIVSLMFMQYLFSLLNIPSLAFMGLAPGPILGLLALRNSNTNNQKA